VILDLKISDNILEHMEYIQIQKVMDSTLRSGTYEENTETKSNRFDSQSNLKV